MPAHIEQFLMDVWRVTHPSPLPLRIFIDADACPVKDEVYRVGLRVKAEVWVVANSYLRVPPPAKMQVVDAGPDAADDWIAEQTKPGDIIITADIPLADRVLKAGGLALSAKGEAFTTASIGSALAQRSLMEHLRSFGEVTGGPKPFSQADRSRFLSALDTALHKANRLRAAAPAAAPSQPATR
jgi:uncharacterized protein YaiI (UPF0178 family)